MLLNPLQLILAAVLFASTHSIFCSDNQPYCSGGKICVHNECRRYRTNIDCSTSGGKCPRGYCCMNQGSSSAGICVRKLNFRLRIGDYCNRQATCDYCQCQPGLVCAKNGFQFFPEAVYTCQENDTFTEQEGDCSEDEQCASDRCCSSSKCKPKKREGERCYPKNGKFWEAYLECNGDCVDGTVCTRDDTQPYYGFYICRTVGSGPEKLCRGS